MALECLLRCRDISGCRCGNERNPLGQVMVMMAELKDMMAELKDCMAAMEAQRTEAVKPVDHGGKKRTFHVISSTFLPREQCIELIHALC